MFDTVCIVGVGLLGGSVGLALKARGLASRVLGIGRNPDRLATARALGAVDSVSTDLAEARDAAVVVLCAPVTVIPEQAGALAVHLRSGTLVTDVGSAKRVICESLADTFSDGVTFVGAHPIAGSHATGVTHARADLFENALCALTPLPETPLKAVEGIERFWSALGARTITLSPERHDAIVAVTSHLPHIAAGILANTVEETCVADSVTRQFLGKGYLDTTRVAAGDAALWRDIVRHNAGDIGAALDTLLLGVATFRAALNHQDWATIELILRSGQAARQRAAEAPAAGDEG